MKKSIKVLSVAAVAMLSATAFAGKLPNTGGGAQGTGATTSSATFGAVVAAVASQGSGVSFSTSPSGVITISPTSPVTGGGISFPPTVVSRGRSRFSVSANDGVITLTPIAD